MAGAWGMQRLQLQSRCRWVAGMHCLMQGRLVTCNATTLAIWQRGPPRYDFGCEQRSTVLAWLRHALPGSAPVCLAPSAGVVRHALARLLLWMSVQVGTTPAHDCSWLQMQRDKRAPGLLHTCIHTDLHGPAP